MVGIVKAVVQTSLFSGSRGWNVSYYVSSGMKTINFLSSRQSGSK